MIKAFFKYLLPLCILLLSGYSQLSAHALKESGFRAPINHSIRVEAAKLLAAQSAQASIINTPLPGAAKENHKRIIVAENEVEEDQLQSFKKLLANSDYLAAVLYAFISAFLFPYLSKGLLFCKHFFPISSYRRHIILQVFRV